MQSKRFGMDSERNFQLRKAISSKRKRNSLGINLCDSDENDTVTRVSNSLKMCSPLNKGNSNCRNVAPKKIGN